MRAGCRPRHADGDLSADYREVFRLAATRGDHLFGCCYARQPATMRGRKIMPRTRFAGEENAAVNRLGQRLPTFRKARRGKRIGAERERVATPAMHTNRFHTLGKIAAEYSHKFGNGKVEKCGLATWFEIGGAPAAKVSFD